MIQIDPDVFGVLACPACHAAFVPPGADDVRLVCSACARSYPVVDGIPVLLLDEAEGGPAGESAGGTAGAGS